MLETLVQQGIEGGIPPPTGECRGGIVVIQDVRFGFAKVVVVVIATLELKGRSRWGVKSERRSGTTILRARKVIQHIGWI